MLGALIKDKYSSLSAAQKKIAQYLINNIEKSSYQTIAQIAKENDVSETTVIRLSYALDFEGFSEMQKEMRKEVLSSYGGTGEGEKEPATSDESMYTAMLEKDIAVIQQMIKQTDPILMDAAAKSIADAQRVYCIGFRTSGAAVKWFGYLLSIVRRNVTVIDSVQQMHINMLDLDSKCAVVVASFSRYSKDTIRFTEYAKEIGAEIIAVTDYNLSPVACAANHVFIVPPNRSGAGFNSISAAVSMLNLILAGVTKLSSGNQKRISMMDKLNDDSEVFCE